MEKTTKLTNVKAFEMVLAMELPQELRTKIETMKASFEKKASYGGSGKPTKTQIENEEIKNEIVTFLGAVEKATVTEVMKRLEREISNQKTSALIRQLVQEEIVERFEEKRKAYFRLVKQD